MKLSSLTKTLATVFAVAITPLGQSAQAVETIPGVAEQPAAYFYTGKPYDADLNGYTFCVRIYDANIARWTSMDSSGYPDGANNNIYVNNTPVLYFDATGLAKGDPVSGIVIKRKDIDLNGADKYGHWWIEIDSESYGWWPLALSGSATDKLINTVQGVPGELNGITNYGGSATQDPHHEDSAPKSWTARHTDGKTDAQVKQLIRGFATSYSGNWSWPSGQNCHSFQVALMAHSFIE